MTETVARSTASVVAGEAELNGAVALRPRRGGRQRVPDTVATAKLRERLVRLRDAADQELERRRIAELEPADGLPVPVRQLSSISRDLPRQMPRAAAAVAGAVRDGGVLTALRGIASFAAEQRRFAARSRRAEAEYDDFGFDEEWTESLLPFFSWLYRVWWRTQVIGLDNVPGEGRALLVSNHAGVLPYDGMMIRTAIHEDHAVPRHARALILNQFFSFPMASWFLRRTGNTLAHPDDAQRLLERDELVLVFPEGAKGTGKLYSERYRLRRFGRGGFTQIALRTGSPIIPVSVVGSEEVHPMIANVEPVARMLGVPYVPLTPTLPLFGLLGFVPLPSSWIIEFHEPIHLDQYGPEAAEDAGLVMHLSDQVRDTIQSGLYRNLEKRGSVFA